MEEQYLCSRRSEEGGECQDASRSEHNRASFSDLYTSLLRDHSSSPSDNARYGDPIAKCSKRFAILGHSGRETEASRQGMLQGSIQSDSVHIRKSRVSQINIPLLDS